MFPVAILISTVAMSSGVEGATFFVPVFMLGLRLQPSVAIGTGLMTEVFGFASGLFAYARKRLIDYKLGMALLLVTVPMAVIGTALSGIIPPLLLKGIFATGLVVVALSFFRSPHEKDVFVILITALLSSAVHFVGFATGGGDDLATVLSIVVFTAPGVVIGGQIGARIASRIPQRMVELTLAVLFIIVAGLTLYQSIA